MKALCVAMLGGVFNRLLRDAMRLNVAALALVCGLAVSTAAQGSNDPFYVIKAPADDAVGLVLVRQPWGPLSEGPVAATGSLTG